MVDEQKYCKYTFHCQKFNSLFIEIGPDLANKIDPPRKKFHEYLVECQACQPKNVISVNELKDALYTLKINKSPGYDDISFNALKNFFKGLCKHLLHIFLVRLG